MQGLPALSRDWGAVWLHRHGGRGGEEAPTPKQKIWLVRAAFSAVAGDFGAPSGEAEHGRTSPEDSASQRAFWRPHLSASYTNHVKMQIPGPTLS